MKSNSDIIVYSDGGARGNPGPGAYGFLIYDKDLNLLFKEGKAIGLTTNNAAEYVGVISAMKWLGHNIKSENIKIEFFLDSDLVVSQLSGRFKVKNENLRSLYFEMKELENSAHAEIKYSHIPREKNKEADKLVNMALDAA